MAVNNKSIEYMLRPGSIKSSDGDTHFIDCWQLAQLYNVDIRECIVEDDQSVLPAHMSQGLKILEPREDGNYVNMGAFEMTDKEYETEIERLKNLQMKNFAEENERFMRELEEQEKRTNCSGTAAKPSEDNVMTREKMLKAIEKMIGNDNFSWDSSAFDDFWKNLRKKQEIEVTPQLIVGNML